MHIDKGLITYLTVGLTIAVLWFILIIYVRPLGEKFDRKIYRKMRLRRFGLDFLSHYFKVFVIWTFMFFVLFDLGVINLNLFIGALPCIVIGTFIAGKIRLKEFRKLDLTLLKRRRGQKRTVKNSK